MAPFGRSRRRIASQPPTQPSASALAAANVATHSRPGTAGSLSSSAAAAALRQFTPPPIPVSQVVTKRMLSRTSSASSQGSSRRASTLGMPSLDSRDSYSNANIKDRAGGPSPTGSESRMTERNLRANSPGPRPGSPGSKHRRIASSLHDRTDAPPVPPLPKTHALSTVGHARAGSGAASPTALRRVESPVERRRDSEDRRMNFSLPTTLRSAPEEPKPMSAFRKAISMSPAGVRGRVRPPAPTGWQQEDDREGGFLARGSMRAKTDQAAIEDSHRYAQRLENNLREQHEREEAELAREEEEREAVIRRKEERRKADRLSRDKMHDLERERQQAGEVAVKLLAAKDQEQDSEIHRQATLDALTSGPRALSPTKGTDPPRFTAPAPISAIGTTPASTSSTSPSPPLLASQRTKSPPLPRAAGPSPIPPFDNSRRSSSVRTDSTSPSRAHFGAPTFLGEDGRKFSPPPRSRSPVKSALKHSTVATDDSPMSPEPSKELVDLSSSSPAPEDSLAVPATGAAQKRKKLSVSFSDDVNLLNTGEIVRVNSPGASTPIMSPPPSAGFPTGHFREELDEPDSQAEDDEVNGRISPSRKTGGLLGSVGFTSIKHLKNQPMFSDDEEDSSKKKGRNVIGISGKPRRGSVDGAASEEIEPQSTGTSSDHSVGAAIMQHHLQKSNQQRLAKIPKVRKGSEPQKHPLGGPLPPVVYSISPPPSSEESLDEDDDGMIDSPPPERTSIGRRIVPNGASTAFTAPVNKTSIAESHQTLYVPPPSSAVDPVKERVQFSSPPPAPSTSSIPLIPTIVAPKSMETFDGQDQQGGPTVPSMNIIPPTPPAFATSQGDTSKQLGSDLPATGHRADSPEASKAAKDEEEEEQEESGDYSTMPGMFPITPEMKPLSHRKGEASKPSEQSVTAPIATTATADTQAEDDSGDSVYSDAMEDWAGLDEPAMVLVAPAGSSTIVEALSLPNITEVVADTPLLAAASSAPKAALDIQRPPPAKSSADTRDRPLSMKAKAQAALAYAAANPRPVEQKTAVPMVQPSKPSPPTKSSPSMEKWQPPQPKQNRVASKPVPKPAHAKLVKQVPPPQVYNDDSDDSLASQSSFRRENAGRRRPKNQSGGFTMRKTMRSTPAPQDTSQSEASRPGSSGGRPGSSGGRPGSSGGFPKTMRGDPPTPAAYSRPGRMGSSGSGLGAMRSTMRGSGSATSRFRSGPAQAKGSFKSRFVDSESDEDEDPGRGTMASRFRSRFANSDSDDSDGGNPYSKKVNKSGAPVLKSSVRQGNRPALHMIPSAGSAELAIFAKDANAEDAEAIERAGIAAVQGRFISRRTKSDTFPALGDVGHTGVSTTTVVGGMPTTPTTPPKRSFFSFRHKPKASSTVGILSSPSTSNRIRKIDHGLDSAARRDTPLERSRTELLAISHTRSSSSRSIGTKSLGTQRPANGPVRSSSFPAVPASGDVDFVMQQKEALAGIDEGNEVSPDRPSPPRRLTEESKAATVSTVGGSSILIGPDGMPIPLKKKKFRGLRKLFRLDE